MLHRGRGALHGRRKLPFSQFRRMALSRKAPLVAGTIYVSEGRDAAIIESLQAIARDGSSFEPSALTKVALLRSFTDVPYHRTSFTFAGAPDAVAARAVAIAAAALARIDLRRHTSAHPRLGAVDHISFHPLGSGTEIESAVAAGATAARRLAAENRVPVLYYGALKAGKRLADVRRELRYFEPVGRGVSGSRKDDGAGGGKDGGGGGSRIGGNNGDGEIGLSSGGGSGSGNGGGSSSGSNDNGSGDGRGWPGGASVVSDEGPTDVDAAIGICTVRLATTDKAEAAAVTKAVRWRDGGLPFVEAMTLRHEGGMWEVACNLLRPRESGPEAVLAAVTAAAAALGVAVDASYAINPSEDDMVAAAVAALGWGKEE